MKKIVIALALTMMVSTVVSAENLIGIFGDMDATMCSADIPVFVGADIYVLAVLEDIDAITGCEFSIGNYITGGGPPNGFLTETWNGLVIGNPIEGISIALDDAPVAGPVVHIGSINIFPFLADWVGINRLMCIIPSQDAGNLIVTDEQFNEIPVAGWCFVANCVPGGDYGNCMCEDAIAVDDTSWGAVKALY